MECSNCGSVYERRVVKLKSEIRAKYCEVCGEELLAEDSSTMWTVKLVERFEKPGFFPENNVKNSVEKNK